MLNQIGLDRLLYKGFGLQTKKAQVAFLVILAIKVLVMILFSSDYQNRLFIPFVQYFIEVSGNPWDYFYAQGRYDQFPYSPVMLYFLSICYAPFYLLGATHSLLGQFFFKLPTLFADLTIFYLLCRMFEDKMKVMIYYFATPIIIYACYMHSQLDLIPTALLFLSVYLLTKRNCITSALVFGLAVCAKLHVVAAFPLLLIYLLKTHKLRGVMTFLFIAPSVFLIIVFPFWTEGYQQLVLNNSKQTLIYDSYIAVGNLKVYFTVLLVAIFYARVSAFRKMNKDLLYTFLALIFSTFVSLAQPSPGWYVWLFPFLSIFFIKFHEKAQHIIRLYVALNVMYLVYMLLFYLPEYHDLIFLKTPIHFKIDIEKYRNVSFTLLEAVLIASMYAFYKFGIRSNFYYKKNTPGVIGISGDSAAGKTTILSDIRKLFGHRVLELEGDADHKWERDDEHWEELTHLNPKANYLHRQYNDILNLHNRNAAFRCDYDHSTGRFTSSRKVRADDYIVLSGLHAFYLPKMRKIIDLKVFVDTDEGLRRYWKVQRDTRDRGRKVKDILKQMDQRALDVKKYIHPQYDFADIVVQYFTDDPIKYEERNARYHMKCKVILDSNVSLQAIVHRLETKLDVTWDYSQDLKNQSLIVDGWLEKEYIAKMAQEYIVNLEELLGDDPIWLDGYRGLVQFMVLLMLSEKLK